MTEGDQSAVQAIRLERKSREILEKLDKNALLDQIALLYDYTETNKLDDVQSLRESEEKCRQQLCDVTRRESMLLKSLTEKEREIADLAAQIEELKQYQLPSNNQLRTMLLEPTVNVVINRLRKELDSTKLRLEESQSELNAWKFTQDSQTGKQLMARCRTLLKENEELGKQISQGRIAKLEGEIALQKKLVEEMKVAQNETEQFVMELDDDTEGLQATIYLLQQQLKEAKERIDTLEGTGSSTPLDQNQADSSHSAQESVSEVMDHVTTDSTLIADKQGDSDHLTLLINQEPAVPLERYEDSTVIVNGTDSIPQESDERTVKLTDKVTTNEDKSLSPPVSSNGHTDMAMVN